MATYRQYCPIARAAEILAERWTLLVIRNLMFGAETYTDIARGVPMMSRSMLTKRLRELERDGVIASMPKPNGQGRIYRLTEAGADLADVVGTLAHWGTRWVEVTTAHTDPGFALWAWAQVQLDRPRLPDERVVVGFTFPEERPGNRRYWLLVEHGDAEVCYSDPGDEPAVEVVAESRAFVDWHRGELSLADAVAAGGIEIHGLGPLVRALPTWNTGEPHPPPLVVARAQ